MIDPNCWWPPPRKLASSFLTLPKEGEFNGGELALDTNAPGGRVIHTRQLSENSEPKTARPPRPGESRQPGEGGKSFAFLAIDSAPSPSFSANVMNQTSQHLELLANPWHNVSGDDCAVTTK